MTTWTSDELAAIAAADDLHIAALRPDGVTLGPLTWIWSVTVDGELYVRAYNGVRSRWYQAAIARGVGRIAAAGQTREVTFQPVDGPVNDRIDDAYRAAYATSPYLAPMISPRARAATIRITPRPAGGGEASPGPS